MLSEVDSTSGTAISIKRLPCGIVLLMREFIMGFRLNCRVGFRYFNRHFNRSKATKSLVTATMVMPKALVSIQRPLDSVIPSSDERVESYRSMD